MSLENKKIEKISDTLVSGLQALKNKLSRIPTLAEQWDLSEAYKAAHGQLIAERRAAEAQQARESSYVPRECIECAAVIELHTGRGRPPIRCKDCREAAL